MQRALLADGRARLVVAVRRGDVEGLGQIDRLAVLNQHRAELERLPGVLLLQLVGDKALLAGAVRLRGKVAVFIHHQQVVFFDVLLAQRFAVADDDALAVVAAEVRVDGDDRGMAAGDVGYRLVDAAAEVVARERGAELADVRELYIADEVGDAVLFLLLDGDAQLVRFIAQFARRVDLEAFLVALGGYGRGRGRGLHLRLFDDGLLAEIDGFRECRARLGRCARQGFDGLLVVRFRPVGEARLHVRDLRKRRAAVTQHHQQPQAEQPGNKAAGALHLRNVKVPLAEFFRVLGAGLFLRRAVVSPQGCAAELIQGFHRVFGGLPWRKCKCA